ncbi:MAG: aminotransferase class V-fold PLP-dependent enzyme [Gemmatimonadota bacterium]|nr:aminotransferase class V-fold PLP-dependent enzyme [Gemmatimonadota bacterium]MDE3004846.1 aminotransferase class V-fold PLP-dependent enzyme [Gemmatimonadota bacterium]MDE3014293.1 aminotransferase class V-fold PLP-dependent enzyme [Gemmatimonadota bacterium]
MPDFEALRDEFPILARKTYLNSCSLGALSKRSEAYLGEFVERWHDMGASAWYTHWLGRVEDLRGRVSTFLGTTTRELALLPSTSTALAAVTESVDAAGRNRVVCTELDFPTLAYQWAVKPEIEMVVLKSPDGVRIDPEQFAEVVDERTLFLATSHVFFATGYEQDLTALARIARDAGAYSLIDGYQGAGQTDLSLPETGVDFYTTGPLKWLLGGPGLSYLYVRAPLVEALKPRLTSWFATKHQFDFDLGGFEYRDDARRFELGTPALPTVHTALGGQEIIDEVGLPAILERNRTLTDHLIDTAEDAGMSLTLAEPANRTFILMIQHDDPPGAVKHLASHGIIVDYRPGHVRVSPHFYNTTEELDRCIDVLASYTA